MIKLKNNLNIISTCFFCSVYHLLFIVVFLKKIKADKALFANSDFDY